MDSDDIKALVLILLGMVMALYWGQKMTLITKWWRDIKSEVCFKML